MENKYENLTLFTGFENVVLTLNMLTGRKCYVTAVYQWTCSIAIGDAWMLNARIDYISPFDAARPMEITSF